MKLTPKQLRNAAHCGAGHLMADAQSMSGDDPPRTTVVRELYKAVALLNAAPAMVEALLAWTCPGCGGTGVYQQRSATTKGPAELVDCKKCGGSKLHPLATAALAPLRA